MMFRAKPQFSFLSMRVILLEPLDGTYIVTYFVDRFLLGAVFGSIGIDEERTFGSQRVFQQAFNASAGMLGAVVNE